MGRKDNMMTTEKTKSPNPHTAPALTAREELIFQIAFNQALAQPVEQAKSDNPWQDRRVFNCPECGGLGLNTMWGVVQFECGAEACDGELCEPCKADPVRNLPPDGA